MAGERAVLDGPRSTVCVFGAGAVGGYLGAQLAMSGTDVTLIARGPHLRAIREHGLQLIKDGVRQHARVKATDCPAEVALPDYVVVTVKAHSLPEVAAQIGRLLGPATTVVTA